MAGRTGFAQGLELCRDRRIILRFYRGGKLTAQPLAFLAKSSDFSHMAAVAVEY
jgi:hypothetical protein